MDYRILKTKENSHLNFDAFLEALEGKSIIYIGEFHQIPEILSFQSNLISALVHKGRKPTICLEMFNVLQQSMLDYYLADAIPFEQLLNLYQAGPEGFDLNHYIQLIQIAAKNNLKAVGLNIPRSIASAVAGHGLDRKELECFQLSEKEIRNCGRKYKKALSAIYKKHPHEDITEENFILAQSIKDEMMAETIAHYMTTDTAGMPLIVITGRGHMEYGLGVPERVRKKIRGKGIAISDELVVFIYAEEKVRKDMADFIISV